ncbi:M15 family metallopeptidase [Antribacter gilvus]|uniref:M15 family metallopeptidase n=1 Tax=Antribacter gilvus TaxID=2304675 RepID=UPI000F76AF7D|nr:M15 family metallopeptidase [Antribacter gilvus]
MLAVAAALTTMALTTTAAASLGAAAPEQQASAGTPLAATTPAATPAATAAPLSPEVAKAVQQATGTLHHAHNITSQLAVAEAERVKIAEAATALHQLVTDTTAAPAATPAAKAEAEAPTDRTTGTASRASEREPLPAQALADGAAALPAEAAGAAPAAAATPGKAQGDAALSDLATAILVDNPLVDSLTVPAETDLEPQPVLGPQAAEPATSEEAEAAPAEATEATSGAAEAAAQTVVTIQEATAALQSLLAAAPSAAVTVVPAPPTPEEIAAKQAAVAAAAAAKQAALARAEAARLAQLAAATAGYPNGQIPGNLLCGLSFAGGEQLRCDATAQLEKLNIAFKARFGRDLAVNDTYRSYASQVATKASKGYLAAVPGTSNHGLGVAIDLSGGVQSFGTAEYGWMRANAPSFGWNNPDWARPGGNKPEAWHWEFGG